MGKSFLATSLSDLETLDRLTYFLVFISAAFVINNGIIEIGLFSLCFVTLLAAYFSNRHTDSDVAQNSQTIIKNSLLYFIQLIGSISFLYLTEDIAATALFVVVLCCNKLRLFIIPQNAIFVIALLVLTVVEFASMAILGAFSQLQAWEGSHGTFYIVAIFGITTAFFYFAAQILKNGTVLENAGWDIVRIVKNKKQEEISRPGSISRVYTLAMFFGAMLPISLAFFSILPKAFLIYTIPLFLGLKISEDIAQDPNWGAMSVKTLKISSLIGLFNILIGVVAK